MKKLKEIAQTFAWMVFALLCLGATKAALHMLIL
jgi:hypothetical protein